MAKRWTLEDQERGLRELANCRGHRTMAAERLKERGLPIPAGTLNQWAYRTKRGRYAEIRTEVANQVHETIADEYETLALQAIETQQVILADLNDKRAELSAKELAQALNATATAGGIATDKSSALRGRATDIVEVRNPYELLNRWIPTLEAHKRYVDGSAEEIEDERSELAAGAEGAGAAATEAARERQRAPD